MSSKAERKSTSSPAASKKSKKTSVPATDSSDESPKKRRKLSTGSTQSCHQCRQSILSNKGISELKAGKARRQCDTCTTYWCENCLENRYGLSFVEISGKHWSCPKCQKTCNCSICRKRAGMLATGILTPLAKEAGFTSVNDFLSKGTGAIAECLQWKEEEKAGAPESPQKAAKGGKRKRVSSEGQQPTAAADADSSPAAKRTKRAKGQSEGRSRRRSDFEIDQGPVRTVHRRTSLEEKRVTAEEYRLRLKQREEEAAKEKEAEKERKKAAKIEDAAKAKELKKKALEEERVRKAAEVEKERRRSKELKQAAVEEARKAKAAEIEEKKEEKRLEMEKLRLERMDEKQRKQEEHKQHLEEIRRQKADERERETEQKKKELASLREEKARARDEEREAKKQQLETLRAHVSQQKQAVKDLLAVNTAYTRSSSSSSGSKPNFSRTPSTASSASASDSESGIDCEFLVPPIVPDETVPDICINIDLPSLPAWEVPVPVSQYHNLLMVSEFLTSFASALGLSQIYSAERLAQTLLNRTTIPTIQLALMKVLLKAEKEEQDEDNDDGFEDDEEEADGRVQLDQLPKLTQSSCQQVVDLYLAMVGYTPDSTGIKGAGRRKMSADDRVVSDKCEKLSVLAFLCERLNSMAYFAELINETSEDLVELQRKHRVAEREVCKQINEELKAWTAEQLMARKDLKTVGEVTALPSASERFSKQISEARSKLQCEHDAHAAAVRGQLLGRDRQGRAYWHLQSVTGILVEEDLTHETPEQSPRKTKKKKDVNPFTICESSDHLDKLLDSMCVDHPTEAALSHQLKLRYNAICTEEAAESE
ncbi:DNA ligase 1-like [Sycon ciliatum]|uniref:DNA ligase 1-like n=1 Tax=Sycon ciliatum TaxID=27933 RepID=UPI0020AC3321|eukprot:scpid44583/ scgid24130/ Cell division cycle-associated 7-like protein; Transcription factor RAM2